MRMLRITASMTRSAPTAARAELYRHDALGPALGRFRHAHAALDNAPAPSFFRVPSMTPTSAAFRIFTREILSA